MRKWSGHNSNNNDENTAHKYGILEHMHVHRPKLTSHIALCLDGFIAPQSRTLKVQQNEPMEQETETKK